MQSHSHKKTLIATLLSHVTTWRKASGWSRESVTQEITDAHERIGGHVVSGICFDPHTSDAYERQKVNADRVFRWLDDATKDNNLLPANFLPSILAAMPSAVAVACLSEILRPLGYGVHVLAKERQAIGVEHLHELIKETAEAQQAVVDLLDGATPQELVIAQKELTEMVDTGKRLLSSVEAEIREVA